jgi:hypothetical protein
VDIVEHEVEEHRQIYVTSTYQNREEGAGERRLGLVGWGHFVYSLVRRKISTRIPQQVFGERACAVVDLDQCPAIRPCFGVAVSQHLRFTRSPWRHSAVQATPAAPRGGISAAMTQI